MGNYHYIVGNKISKLHHAREPLAQNEQTNVGGFVVLYSSQTNITKELIIVEAVYKNRHKRSCFRLFMV